MDCRLPQGNESDQTARRHFPTETPPGAREQSWPGVCCWQQSCRPPREGSTEMMKGLLRYLGEQWWSSWAGATVCCTGQNSPEKQHHGNMREGCKRTLQCPWESEVKTGAYCGAKKNDKSMHLRESSKSLWSLLWKNYMDFKYFQINCPSFFLWFITQMATTAGTGSGQSLEPEISHKSPVWIDLTQVLPICGCFL